MLGCILLLGCYCEVNLVNLIDLCINYYGN